MNKQNNDNKNTKISELVFQIQEDERNRIARDLHDSSLQDLTYLVHKLELVELYLDKDPDRAKFELLCIKKSLKKTIDDIRNIVFDLRPMMIDDLGLKESFDVFFDWLKVNTDFRYVLDINPIYGENDFLLNLYRIVVECVLNAVKHSDGDEILFRCKEENNYTYLWIEDNGKGFILPENNDKKNHYGLSIIRERVEIFNGNINIKTDEQGSKIYISLPNSSK